MSAVPEPLSPDAIKTALQSLRGWVHADGALRKTFVFGSFREAISFIVRVGFAAEAANHHPEITNVYSRVEISLSTHDAGDQVTDNDASLAAEVERFSWV